MVITVTDEEVASITQSILTRYGIDFTCYEPKSLKRRITRILNNFNFLSIHELWIKLLREPDFIKTFMNEISVGMTSMFRDPILWKRLKHLSQKEFTSRGDLSIWHAGCSTGEEVYSMGILLRETQQQNKTKGWATDINENAIATAQKGEYHKIHMIENERNYKEYNSYSDFIKYTQPVDGKHVRVDPSLISHVKFNYHNLITDKVPGTYDLILCRNVMIYFDCNAKKKLVEKFHEALNPGGYFIIGFYDTMLSMLDQSKFELVDEDAKIFRKL